ncbi:MAG TPA: Hsp20 family protein [Propionibacteriaceae bacterium]|nr:Hsp20 family protein [Propionibacteriaceae bacterium]
MSEEAESKSALAPQKPLTATRWPRHLGARSEFRYGSFVRQVRLPKGTGPDVISAAYRDGVLEIRMPKPSGEPTKQRIQIERR